MGRKAKTYTIVSIEEGDTPLVSFNYANLEAVRDAIAKRDLTQGAVLIFEGEPIPYQVKTEPTITIGAPKTRAKRTAKAKKLAVAPAVKA